MLMVQVSRPFEALNSFSPQNVVTLFLYDGNLPQIGISFHLLLTLPVSSPQFYFHRAVDSKLPLFCSKYFLCVLQSVTPRDSVRLQKFLVTHLVKKFPVFYCTRRFSTLFMQSC
jgi:hypothetical protein